MNSLVLEVAVGLALLYYVTATLVSGATPSRPSERR